MQIVQAERHDQPRDASLGLSDVDADLPIVCVMSSTINAMYTHAQGEMQHEVGGYLLGWPLRDTVSGRLVTYIEDTCRARYESTPTFVTMHADGFIDVEKVRENRLLVGYYHSHPGLGIFLSGTDVQNFGMYHPEPYQIAIVVDPSKTPLRELTAHSEAIGIFAWKATGQPTRLGPRNIKITDARPAVELRPTSSFNSQPEVADAS